MTHNSIPLTSPNLPDIMRQQPEAVFLGSTPTFAGMVTLAQQAGLHAWATEHRSGGGIRVIQEGIAEEFKTPQPHDAVALWRETAGYEYGDKLPKAHVAMRVVEVAAPTTFDLAEDSNPFETTYPDSGIRLAFGIPRKDALHNVSVLDIPIYIAQSPSLDGSSVADLALTVGDDIGVERYHRQMSPRASQELLIGAKRFMGLSEGLPADQLPEPLPYANKPKRLGNPKLF